MANEIELKLRIDAADVARLRRHPALLRPLHGEPLTRRLTSIYYDTPDLRLLDAAISLRVRHMAGGWFQAVKGAGHSLGGLHQRMEWEDVIAGDAPDFGKITEPGLAAIFADPALRSALRPIFVTDVERTEWQLAFEDGSEIEAALDLGELRPGTGSVDWPHERICELELELKHGKAAHIFALALVLQADIPLQIENVSKAQRGYAHFRPSALPAPASSSSLNTSLPAAMTTGDAFRHLAGRCLQQLQDAQLLLQSDARREDIVSAQLALERLHFLLKLFEPRANELRQELKRGIALLDAVHDRHVLTHHTLPALGAQRRPELVPLQQLALVWFERALHRLKRWQQGRRCQRLLLQLGAVLASDVAGQEKAAALIDAALQREDRKLRAQIHHLPQLGTGKLQRRIRRLSYGMALLETDPEADVNKAYLAGLARLEDALAVLHALEFAAARSRRLPSDAAGDDVPVAISADETRQARERVAAALLALPAIPRPAPKDA